MVKEKTKRQVLFELDLNKIPQTVPSGQVGAVSKDLSAT